MLHAARSAVRSASRRNVRTRNTFRARRKRRTFRRRRFAAHIRTSRSLPARQPRRGGPRLYEPADAVTRLRTSFERIALRLAPRDAFLREDLAQEMALAVLALQHKRSLARFRTWAAWRARDYVRRFGAAVRLR